VGHFKRKFQVEGVIARQPLFLSEIYSDCLFIWYQNGGFMFFLFVTKHAYDRQTDGRTDGQNYDPQYRFTMAASRGKNE